MSNTVKSTIEDLTARAGLELGASDYHLVMQGAIDAFAEATGDRQWIHTDPERAAGDVLTFEREAGGKPVCVAQTLYRIYDER